MERVIHKYFDKMEDLEERISNEVDTLVSKIDVKAVLQDPLTEMTAVVSILLDMLEEDYNVEAFNAGKKFAEDIKK